MVSIIMGSFQGAVELVYKLHLPEILPEFPQSPLITGGSFCAMPEESDLLEELQQSSRPDTLEWDPQRMKRPLKKSAHWTKKYRPTMVDPEVVVGLLGPDDCSVG